MRECIAEGILSEYLSRKDSEVVNMLMAEYDYDMDIAVQRKEAAEEAEARGRMEGIRLMKEAQKLHAQGKEAEKIAGILELPVEQVKLMLS